VANAPANVDEQYLAALRAANVPTSVSGSAEVQIAQGICKQLAGTASAAGLARDIASSMGWTTEQATIIVETAQRFYC